MKQIIHSNQAQHGAVVVTSGFRLTPWQWEAIRATIRRLAREANVEPEAQLRFDLVLSVTEDDQR